RLQGPERRHHARGGGRPLELRALGRLDAARSRAKDCRPPVSVAVHPDPGEAGVSLHDVQSRIHRTGRGPHRVNQIELRRRTIVQRRPPPPPDASFLTLLVRPTGAPASTVSPRSLLELPPSS